jgi:hypothetical protein
VTDEGRPEGRPAEGRPAETPEELAALDEILFELTAPHTQQEIADRLRIANQRVSEIEARALETLRQILEDEGKADWRGALLEPRGSEIADAGMTRTHIRDRSSTGNK